MISITQRPTAKILFVFFILAGMLAFPVSAQKKAAAEKNVSGKTAIPKNSREGAVAAARPRNLSDSALLDIVQKQTFRYFWDFAHPVSGMARERSNEAYNYGNEVVTTGGTGFGVMAMIVATDRKWISRDTAARHLLKMVNFLLNANSYHGVFPHWMDGATGRTIPFSRKDDGADLVETSYLFEGLLCVRQYFNQSNP